MSFAEYEMGVNDDAVGNEAPRKFKVEENKEYVLSFAWWPEGDDGKPDLSGNPRLIGSPSIFIDKVGKVLYQGPEYQQFSKGGEEPRTYLGTVIIQWPLDASGKIDKAKVKAKKWQVMPFIMSEGKYADIRSQHGRFSLGENDVHVKCPKGGTQYQQMKFQPNPGSVFGKLVDNDKIWSILKAQIEACIPKVKSEIGREMTIAQIREKLGEDGPQPVDLGDEEDPDAMIDDILEED